MNSKKLKKLLIIPAFNESQTLPSLIEEIKAKAPDYDYVIVNDGSTDDTKNVCRTNGLNVIHLPINLGIGGAMQTGYLYAYQNQYDIAIQIDGDGQHDPDFLESLIEPITKKQSDMVIGSRFIRKEGFQSSFLRRIGINILSLIIFMLTGKKYLDVTSGLRACNRKVIELFSKLYPEDYPETESLMMLLVLGYKVEERSVIMRERFAGISSIYFINSIYFMIKVTFAIFTTRLRSKKSINL